jgi:hypothetical protein
LWLLSIAQVQGKGEIRLKKKTSSIDTRKIVQAGLKFRKLFFFFGVAVVFTVMVAQQNGTVYSFFQSPAISPVEQPPTNTPEPPTPPPPATDTPAPAQAADTPTPPPADTPTPEPTPTETPISAVVEGEDAPGGELSTDTETPLEEQQAQALPEGAERPVAPVVAPVPATPLVQLPPSEVAPAPGDPGVVVNEAKLIDTFAQWFAYVWLCVGMAVILAVPLFFLFLQLRGTRLSR